MRAWRAVGAVGLVVGFGVGVLGCSSDDGGSQKTLSASEVCGGALTSHAAKSLEFLTGTKDYPLSSGGKAELASAVQDLEDGYVPAGDAANLAVKPTSACSVPNLEIQGTSDVRVQFSFATAREADRKTFAEHARYEVGRNAFVNSDWAYLYFDCVSRKLKGSTDEKPAIISSVLSDSALSQHRNQPKGTQRQINEANLSVVNSVALKVAEKLQCEGNGGLTSNPTFRSSADAEGRA